MASGIRVTPEQFVEKHARRTIAAVPDYTAGVNRVTTAPGIEAAKKQAKMKANLIKAIDSGKWGRRVASVSLEDWKEAAGTKGAGRIAAGVEAASPKVRAFAEQVLPVLARIKSEVDAMADLTLEDGIARMTKQVREMAKFEFKR